MKTMIVINSALSSLPDIRKPSDLFSGEEVDRIDEEMFAGMSREQLFSLRQKLSDTFDWLDSGDCAIDSPEMRKWEERLDRLNDLLDRIDEILEPDEKIW